MDRSRNQSSPDAWTDLLAAAGRVPNTCELPRALLREAGDGSDWRIRADTPAESRALLSLYLPLCAAGPGAVWRVGHLGQSLNGCIATESGESCFVTGPENILHLHRMRALCDAVIVGAGTVANDDPRLTTRLVPGPSPVRVVLDPRRGLSSDYRIFQDGVSPTLLCTATAVGPAAHGRAEVLSLPADDGELDLPALVDALAKRGLRRLFVEGGGVTVSRFLSAGLLTRLQVAVAPVIIGQGRCGLTLPRVERLDEAVRVAPRIFRMGEDVLYDLDLAEPRNRPETVTGLVQVLGATPGMA